MRPFPLLLVLAACAGQGDDDLDDTDGERPDGLDCDDVTTSLAFEADSPLGFAAADVADALVGETTVDAWMGPGPATISVTVGLSDLGAPTFHDLEPAEDTDGGSETDLPLGAPDAGPCADYLEIPATVTFASGDGAFDETLAVALRALTPVDASAGADLDPDALEGTFTITEIDPDDWDEVSLSFSNSWGEGTVRGELYLSASRDLGGGMGEGFVGPVLRWPAE